MNKEQYPKESKYIEELKNLLIKNIEDLTKNKEIALAFSGGVDSAIIAKILKDLKIKFTAYVIGIENCKDFYSAEEVAKELNLNLKKIIIDKKEIEKELPVQIKILKELYQENREKIKPETPSSKLNPVSVTSNFPLLFVEKYSKEKYIISGLGADTLFGGFKKYIKLKEKESDEEIKKQTKILVDFDYLEDIETAKYFNKIILMPFLSKEIVDFCLKLPYELKINEKSRKYILRKLAKNIGLTDESAFREKKSAQYGTGIMKTIEKLARQKNMNIAEYMKTLE